MLSSQATAWLYVTNITHTDLSPRPLLVDSKHNSRRRDDASMECAFRTFRTCAWSKRHSMRLMQHTHKFNILHSRDCPERSPDGPSGQAKRNTRNSSTRYSLDCSKTIVDLFYGQTEARRHKPAPPRSPTTCCFSIGGRGAPHHT